MPKDLKQHPSNLKETHAKTQHPKLKVTHKDIYICIYMYIARRSKQILAIKKKETRLEVSIYGRAIMNETMRGAWFKLARPSEEAIKMHKQKQDWVTIHGRTLLLCLRKTIKPNAGNIATRTKSVALSMQGPF